jgi:flagellar motor protein MotB
MTALAATLRHLDNRVELAGHAEPGEPAAPHASPWELSLLRALAVADLLREAGYERPLSERGYGSAGPSGTGGRVDLVVRADAGDAP